MDGGLDDDEKFYRLFRY